MDAIESRVQAVDLDERVSLAEELATEAEDRVREIREFMDYPAPEIAWAVARLEAFARYLREAWAVRNDRSYNPHEVDTGPIGRIALRATWEKRPEYRGVAVEDMPADVRAALAEWEGVR